MDHHPIQGGVRILLQGQLARIFQSGGGGDTVSHPGCLLDGPLQMLVQQMEYVTI